MLVRQRRKEERKKDNDGNGQGVGPSWERKKRRAGKSCAIDPSLSKVSRKRRAHLKRRSMDDFWSTSNPTSRGVEIASISRSGSSGWLLKLSSELRVRMHAA